MLPSLLNKSYPSPGLNRAPVLSLRAKRSNLGITPTVFARSPGDEAISVDGVNGGAPLQSHRDCRGTTCLAMTGGGFPGESTD